jgi:hypothetical protein
MVLTPPPVSSPIQLFRRGYLWCQAYPSPQRTIRGAQIKASVYPVTVTASQLQANVSIGRLTALTQFWAYCYRWGLGRYLLRD